MLMHDDRNERNGKSQMLIEFVLGLERSVLSTGHEFYIKIPVGEIVEVREKKKK